MIFTEIEPNENFDLRRFQSVPEGRWEAGIIKMLWAKYRVRLSLADSQGFCILDYWGGERDTSEYLLGLILGTCSLLPETITEEEICKIFPKQYDKELDRQFFAKMFKAGDYARAVYPPRLEKQ